MDFSELGREIGEKVNKFVNSKEIKDLQENIRVTVESTVDEVCKSARGAADYVNKNVETYRESQFQNGAKSNAPAQEKPKSNASAPKKPKNYTKSGNAVQIKPSAKRQLPVVRRANGGASGVVMSVLGTCGAVVGWSATALGYSLSFLGGIDIFANISLLNGVMGVLSGLGMAFGGVLAVFAGLCTIMAAAGGVLRRRARRFKSYVKTMGTKDFYSITSLAQAVGKNEKYVIKDLKKMIHRGWFREGHLDEQETCFMLTDESYQMYLDAQTQLKNRKEEEERLKKEAELLEQDPVRKQLKLTVEEGREYIRRIREINDEIPGEDISNKLYRLEKVCSRIFQHIEENPEKLQDIRKFMNYYLPTTLKLVETYYEFSIQPVQGENITTSKQEIEGMLDSINGAFEKMFDKLFEDDAMDISTDISVLSTMLAQEGLLEDELKVK